MKGDWDISIFIHLRFRRKCGIVTTYAKGSYPHRADCVR